MALKYFSAICFSAVIAIALAFPSGEQGGTEAEANPQSPGKEGEKIFPLPLPVPLPLPLPIPIPVGFFKPLLAGIGLGAPAAPVPAIVVTNQTAGTQIHGITASIQVQKPVIIQSQSRPQQPNVTVITVTAPTVATTTTPRPSTPCPTPCIPPCTTPCYATSG